MIGIHVDCRTGYLGEKIPCRLILGRQCVAVLEVRDRWLAPDHRYFKIRGEDGGIYLIRHDPIRNRWLLVCFKATLEMDQHGITGAVDDPTAIC